MKLMYEWMQEIMHLFYPNLCLGCEQTLLNSEKKICINCWQQLPMTNFHLQENNLARDRFLGRVSIEHASAMFYFHKDSVLQSILHSLKYKNQTTAGELLGKRMGYLLQSSSWMSSIDILLPVPLAKAKLSLRGYNQSEHIARGIHEIWPIPIDTTSVIRNKNTKSQTTMTITERIENMKNAFNIIDPEKLRNKHVLLIDDVMTTGATLESLSQCLLSTIPLKLSILTVAYAID